MIQIVTLVFVIAEKHYLRLVTTSTADMIASAQALRITRKLWKVGRRQKQWDEAASIVPQSSEQKSDGDAENGQVANQRQSSIRHFIDLE